MATTLTLEQAIAVVLEHRSAGREAEAEAACRQLLVQVPGHAGLWNLLGLITMAARQYGEALMASQRAVALNPQYASAHLTVGNVFYNLDRHESAIAEYRRAIQLEPTLHWAFCGMGNSLLALGDLAGSESAYRQGLVIKADDPDLHWGLSIVLLRQGKYQEGWIEHEWRGLCPAFAKNLRKIPGPLWTGELLHDKRILIFPEQGLGDTIQFLRYLPMVTQRCRNVVLGCTVSMVRLVRGLYKSVELALNPDFLPAYDVQCPMMTLPRLFGTTVETIPNRVPYLRAEENDVREWADKLNRRAGSPAKQGESDGALKVGLCWAGSASHVNDRNRSIHLRELEPLAQVEGVEFHSLQKGPAGRQTAAKLQPVDWTPVLSDMSDTAALIENLDLVISVDTSVAHLAGALGKEVWLLLPFWADWRWLMDREDSPWYPTMRLFQQKSWGNWGEVIARVSRELKQRAGRWVD